MNDAQTEYGYVTVARDVGLTFRRPDMLAEVIKARDVYLNLDLDTPYFSEATDWTPVNEAYDNWRRAEKAWLEAELDG